MSATRLDALAASIVDGSQYHITRSRSDGAEGAGRERPPLSVHDLRLFVSHVPHADALELS
jgi:hypothetical protein